MIEIVKTSASVHAWRLAVYEAGRQQWIPYASCRRKRDAVALKAQLEAAADWSRRDLWDDETFERVREVLSHTESARLHAEGLAASARWGGMP